MRRLVVGDVHGGYKALLQCIERSGYEKEHDQLIFLGDYVDGWGETYEVIDFLVDLERQAIHKPIFIRGNHDDWFNWWLTHGTHPVHWLQGGLATAQSYIRYIEDREIQIVPVSGGYHIPITYADVPLSHRQFFRRLHNYYLSEDNLAFVHGGYYNGLGEDESHVYFWDRDLWQLDALPGHKSQNKPKRLRLYKEIFIGHTTTLNWKTDKPMNKCNVWNLDTGGGWNGKLTIMDVDTKEYWQSDLVKELYPNERGR